MRTFVLFFIIACAFTGCSETENSFTLKEGDFSGNKEVSGDNKSLRSSSKGIVQVLYGLQRDSNGKPYFYLQARRTKGAMVLNETFALDNALILLSTKTEEGNFSDIELTTDVEHYENNWNTAPTFLQIVSGFALRPDNYSVYELYKFTDSYVNNMKTLDVGYARFKIYDEENDKIYEFYGPDFADPSWEIPFIFHTDENEYQVHLENNHLSFD